MWVGRFLKSYLSPEIIWVPMREQLWPDVFSHFPLHLVVPLQVHSVIDLGCRKFPYSWLRTKTKLVREFQMLIISVFLKVLLQYSQLKVLLSIPRKFFAVLHNQPTKTTLFRFSQKVTYARKIVNNNYFELIYIKFSSGQFWPSELLIKFIYLQMLTYYDVVWWMAIFQRFLLLQSGQNDL